MRTSPEKPKKHQPQPDRPRPKPGGSRQPDPKTCEPACSPIITHRNRYYTGRFMVAHDFRQEQSYFLNRHRLHNRLLHGFGIVCGLDVRPHPNPKCANRVVVQPGIAIDCCGREIILEKPQVVEVWPPELPPECKPLPEQPDETGEDRDGYGKKPEQGYEQHRQDDKPQEQPDEQRNPKRQYPPEEPGEEDEPAYLIYVWYCEEEGEFAPVLYDDGSCGDVCGDGRLEANRICEVACLHVIPWDAANREAHAGCWPDGTAQPQPCRDDCEGDPDAPQTGCLEPVCRCDLCVPLALVRPVSSKGGYAITEDSLDFSGRTELQTPAGYLTHISGINWPHGGQVSLSQLRDPAGMNGQLRITFDRKLLAPDPDDTSTATGINESTFTVQIHRQDDVQYPMEILYNDGNLPYLDESRCEAVFSIDDELLEGYQNLGDSLLHITLRCDFILDCHRRPVDGEHRKGMLPSGDGHSGGTFESWVWVTNDDEERRPPRRRKDRRAE